MSRFRFELAGPGDDADLRHILANTIMAGQIGLSFCREPSYFEAAVVEGRFRQVVAARDLDSGRLVGFGARSVSRRYLNGQPADVGYLSSLRLLPGFRGSNLIARGFAYFRRLHADGRARLYLTTISEDNQAALQVLAQRQVRQGQGTQGRGTQGRAGLPCYHPWGRYHTLVIPLRQSNADSVTNPPSIDGVTRRSPRKPSADGALCRVRPARGADLPQLLRFLARAGARRQFFGCCRQSDFQVGDFQVGELQGDEFQDGEAMFRSLRLENLLLAIRDDRIVGCLGGWDQSGFRQSVVRSYGAALRWTRPIYNLWAAVRRWPPLPRPGERLRYWTAALPLVEGDDLDVFTRLLQAVRSHLDRSAGDYLLLGLHQRDPLLPVARRCSTLEYTTQLFVVCWPDGETDLSELDDRPPYLELGQL